MIEQRAREVSKHRGLVDYPCKKCGILHTVDDVEIEYKAGKRGQLLIQAFCPDCGAFIRRMSNSVNDRIFWRGAMHNVEDIDTSLLLWMLQVGYIKDERTVGAVRQHLKGRIVTNKTIEPMSIIEQREATMKKELRGLRVRISELEKKKTELNYDIVKNSHAWDALKTTKAINRIKWHTKEISRLTKEADEKENELYN